MARLSEIPRENLEFMAQDIGKELLPFLPPKELVARLTAAVLLFFNVVYLGNVKSNPHRVSETVLG